MLHFTDFDSSVFWHTHPTEAQADKIMVDAVPFPLSPPHTFQSPNALKQSGTSGSDVWVSPDGGAVAGYVVRAQMAVQEASGVMQWQLLQQQGDMREVSVWESEVRAR